MRGKVLVYPRDSINTDEIIPARYLTSDVEAELAKHAMEDIDRSFVSRARTGDFVVAGEDFGCGSSREHAVWALRGAGVRAVIAGSFARIYFRNSINNGLLAIECPGIAAGTCDGDEMEIDISRGVIRNLTKGDERRFVAMPAFAMEIIADGGLMEHIAKGRKGRGNHDLSSARKGRRDD
jgi:3-isopropylmalate/(R)-2-methylmalate dehydratase small subunit